MAKEIYLYAPIYDFIAESVISQINDNMGGPVTMRTLTPGGKVFAAYGIYAKLKEHGNVHMKVDGCADSAGSYLPMYAKSAECLSVSRFTFHRADMFVENQQEQDFIDGINSDLKAQMLSRINPDKWLKVTGVSIEDMFNPTTRKDITLNGRQALEVGLVQKVIDLSPEAEKDIAAIHNKFYNIAAELGESTPKTMTVEEIKTKFPDAYKSIFAAGKAKGVKTEYERGEAILVFAESNPKKAVEAFKTGKPLSPAQTTEFLRAEMAIGALKVIEGENADPITVNAEATGKPLTAEAAAKAKEAVEFSAAMTAQFNKSFKKQAK